MTNIDKKTWYIIDILKFIFSICIIALHTGVLSKKDYYYWIEYGLFRLAVPFFMITTGFLLAAKAKEENSIRSAVKLYSIRLLRLLLVFETISLILTIIGWVLEKKYTFFHIILLSIRSILFYPVGALWYIQAAIIGMWILLFFVEKKDFYMVQS